MIKPLLSLCVLASLCLPQPTAADQTDYAEYTPAPGSPAATHSADMKIAIKKDRALLISGFGKFECYDKASRKGRNPKTDETITLPPRKVMVFRLSRKLRAELNP